MRKKTNIDWVLVVMVDSQGRLCRRRMRRILAKKMSREDAKPGIVDGVAGDYTSPNFLSVPSVRFISGTNRYRRAVYRRLRNATEALKQEVPNG